MKMKRAPSNGSRVEYPIRLETCTVIIKDSIRIHVKKQKKIEDRRGFDKDSPEQISEIDCSRMNEQIKKSRDRTCLFHKLRKILQLRQTEEAP